MLVSKEGRKGHLGLVGDMISVVLIFAKKALHLLPLYHILSCYLPVMSVYSTTTLYSE